MPTAGNLKATGVVQEKSNRGCDMKWNQTNNFHVEKCYMKIRGKPAQGAEKAEENVLRHK